MQTAFYTPTHLSDINWFSKTAIDLNFSEEGLRALNLYIQTLPKVTADVSKFTKIELHKELSKFVEVFEFSDGQYIILK